MSAPDSSQWPALADIDPELAEILKEGPIPEFLQDPSQIQDIRAGLSQNIIQSTAALDKTGVVEETIDIPVREGAMPPAYIFKPINPPASGSPLAMLIHGGGFVLGHPLMEIASAHILVRQHGAVVVSIDYRLAPEHAFPGPVNDAWDALQWVAANATALGADPSRGFLVGGTSAGAHIAAVVALLARDERLSPPLTAQFLSMPAVLYPDVVPVKYQAEYTSFEQNRAAPLLSAGVLKVMRDAYKPDIHSPLAVPFNWPTGLAELPRTYIQVCGLDPTRDESLLYERELRAQGVDTHLDIYPGLPHGFWAVLPQLSKAKTELADRTKALAWLLRKGGVDGKP